MTSKKGDFGRVLFVSKRLPKKLAGGSDIVGHYFCTQIASVFDVDVFLFDVEDSSVDEGPDSIRIFKVPDSETHKVFPFTPFFHRGYSFLFGSNCVFELNRKIETENYSAIIFFSTYTAWLAEKLVLPTTTRKVLIAHDYDAETFFSIARNSKNPFSKLYFRSRGIKVSLEIRKCVWRFDELIVISGEDLNRYSKIFEGTRLHRIRPQLEKPKPILSCSTIDNVLITGSFSWRRKFVNVRNILRNVWPEVSIHNPDTVLRIAGFEASRLVSATKGLKRVEIVDSPLIMDNLMKRPGISLVAENQNSGVKVKTVQAALYGRAIVSSPGGVEGTDFVNGVHCLVANTNSEYKIALNTLLSDSEMREEISKNALSLASSNFGAHSQTLAQNLDSIRRIVTGKT